MAKQETERKFLLSRPHAEIERESCAAGTLKSRKLLSQRYLGDDLAGVRLLRSRTASGRARCEVEFRFDDGQTVRVEVDEAMHADLAPFCREDAPGPDPDAVSSLKLKRPGDWTIRIRRCSDPSGSRVKHVLTMKRPVSSMTCDEPESSISPQDHDLVALRCGPALRKRRIKVLHRGRTWEVDLFANPELGGLSLAEIELPSEDAALVLPPWVGDEVTGERLYRNVEIQARLAA